MHLLIESRYMFWSFFLHSLPIVGHYMFVAHFLYLHIQNILLKMTFIAQYDHTYGNGGIMGKAEG